MAEKLVKLTGLARSYYVNTSRGWSFLIIQKYQTNPGFYMCIGGDYGSYGHGWSSFGDKTPEQALLSFDRFYIQNKLEGARFDFDGELLYKQIKKDVIESRRKDDITAEFARDIFNEVNSLNDRYGITDQSVTHAIYMESKSIMKYYHHDPSVLSSGNIPLRQLTSFFDELWPHFIEMFKEYEPKKTT